MRVILISFDALEHSLVEKFDCKILKQKEYGLLDLEPYFQQRPQGVGSREAMTPEVYATFITGKIPTSEDEIIHQHRINQRFPAHIKLYPVFIHMIGQRKYPTFFDFAKKPLAFDLPMYSRPEEKMGFIGYLTGVNCLWDYYWHKNGCPPNVKYITEILDFNKPFWIVYSEFDLDNHVHRMKQKHPKWSDRQLRCVLYWQNTARKRLKEIAKIAQYETGAGVVLFYPEAHGVNIYATCQKHGLILDPIKNLKICRHIALMGQSNG